MAFDPSLNTVLSGAGTNTLFVTGVTVRIDATALIGQPPTFTIPGLGSYSTGQVQTLALLPGSIELQAGALQFDFTLSAQDQLDFDAGLDSEASGRGTNTLVITAT